MSTLRELERKEAEADRARRNRISYAKQSFDFDNYQTNETNERCIKIDEYMNNLAEIMGKAERMRLPNETVVIKMVGKPYIEVTGIVRFRDLIKGRLNGNGGTYIYFKKKKF